MKHSLLFVCCIFFCACNNADDNAGNVRTIRFDIDEQSREISFFDIFERVDIIPLETSDSSLLSPAIVAAVYNDTTYAMDFLVNKNIKTYSPSGAFISTLCQKGDAPDDYIAAANIFVNPYTGHFELLENNNTLNIYDRNTKKKITKLKLGSEQFSKPAQQCFPVDENKYALFSSFSSENNILVYDSKTEQRTLLTKPVSENIIKAGLNHNFAPFRMQPNGTITLNTLLDRNIYKYEHDALVPYTVLDFGEKHNIDNYILPSTPVKDVKNILNDNKDKIVSGVFPPIKWGNKFFCTIMMGEENYNLYSNLHTGENACFKTTTEGVTFSTGGVLVDDTLYNVTPINILDKYITESILDEKNKNILLYMKEDDNPVILRYKLKK